MRTASIRRSPSLSRGMNSPPRLRRDRHAGADERQGHDHRGHRMADKGVERRLIELLDPAEQPDFLLLGPGRSGPSRPAPASRVSDNSSEPARAKITVRAMGRNSFPSVPWSARIGR